MSLIFIILVFEPNGETQRGYFCWRLQRCMAQDPRKIYTKPNHEIKPFPPSTIFQQAFAVMLWISLLLLMCCQKKPLKVIVWKLLAHRTNISLIEFLLPYSFCSLKNQDFSSGERKNGLKYLQNCVRWRDSKLKVTHLCNPRPLLKITIQFLLCVHWILWMRETRIDFNWCVENFPCGDSHYTYNAMIMKGKLNEISNNSSWGDANKMASSDESFHFVKQMLQSTFWLI